MEENQGSINQGVQETPQDTQVSGVGFPSPQPIQGDGINKKWVLVAVVLVVLLVIGGIFFLSRRGGSEEEVMPSETTFEESTSVPEPTSTSTPVAVDKSKVAIEIQNGTGISGEAAFLQTKLKVLGYTKIEVKNAASTDNETTTVTFSKSLSQTVVDEITKELENIYKDVTVKTSSTQSADVVIITGLRKGQTPKPETTATPTTKPTSSGTPTPTPTPTKTRITIATKETPNPTKYFLFIEDYFTITTPLASVLGSSSV